MMCKEKLPLISIITGSVSKNSLSLLRGPSYHIAVRDGCYYSFSRLLLKNDPKETAPTPQDADTYLRLNDLTEGSSDPLDPLELSQIERGGPLVFDTFIKSSTSPVCMYHVSYHTPTHTPVAVGDFLYIDHLQHSPEDNKIKGGPFSHQSEKVIVALIDSHYR